MSLILASGQTIEIFFFGNPASLVFYSFFTDQSLELEEFQAVFDHIITTFSLISNLFEFLFLLVILKELARLGRGAASLFSSSRRNLARKRIHKNVITGVGHFISWLTEISFFGILQVIVVANKDSMGLIPFIFFMLYPSINYVIFPTVQTLTSNDLRNHVFGCICFSCNCARCKNDNQEGTEHIEMNVLNTNVINVNHM